MRFFVILKLFPGKRVGASSRRELRRSSAPSLARAPVALLGQGMGGPSSRSWLLCAVVVVQLTPLLVVPNQQSEKLSPLPLKAFARSGKDFGAQSLFSRRRRKQKRRQTIARDSRCLTPVEGASATGRRSNRTEAWCGRSSAHGKKGAILAEFPRCRRVKERRSLESLALT